MVKIFFCLFMMIGIPVFVASTDVSASVDNTLVIEGKNASGTITVTHDRKDPVQMDSFLLGSKSITVEKVKDVVITPTSPIILSIYKFNLPPQTAGLQILPPISVTVAGKKYSSIESSYQVEKAPAKAVISPAPNKTIQNPSTQAAEPPILRLEASVDGPTSLYPTQKTRLVYRYFFNENVDLTEEKLPLLDATGLVKIGEKQIRDVQDGPMSAREIVQEVEASLPGTYTFGPSTIAGYAFREDLDPSARTLLNSEAPAVTIVVLPFPEQQKPLAFNGAVGEYSFSTHLIGNKKVDVGDDLSLELKIQGKGNLQAVPLPDVCCQPGFVGMFRVSDLPPKVTVNGDTKTATILLKPLTSSLTQIPSISFASYNPEKKEYLIEQSNPIDIVVKSVIPKKIERIAKTPQQTPQPPEIPIQLSSTLLTSDDLLNNPLGTWWSLLIIPFGILFLLYQKYLHNYLQRRSDDLSGSSTTFLRMAKKEKDTSPWYFEHLMAALKQRVYEAGLIPSPNTPLELWPQEGKTAEVVAWTFFLQEARFSGRTDIDIKSLEKKAENIFWSIPVISKYTFGDLLKAWSPLLFFVGLFVIALLLWHVPRSDSRVEEAQKIYQNGTTETSLISKQESLLKAAQMYHALENEYRPNYGTGRLEIALGNAYAQLGDIPLALWYSRKAESLRPRDVDVKDNIYRLEKTLYLEPKNQFKDILSLPEWIQIFFILALSAIIFCSFAIWFRMKWVVSLAKLAIFCMLLGFVPLMYYKYFSPLYGTLITSTNVQAGPSNTFPIIGQDPLASGSVIEVIGLNGNWLQIHTGSTVGYIPSEIVRL